MAPAARITAANLIPAVEIITETHRSYWGHRNNKRKRHDAREIVAGLARDHVGLSFTQIAELIAADSHDTAREAYRRWQRNWSAIGREIAYASVMDIIQAPGFKCDT